MGLLVAIVGSIRSELEDYEGRTTRKSDVGASAAHEIGPNWPDGTIV